MGRFDVENGADSTRERCTAGSRLAELSLPLSAVCALTNLAIDKRVISNYFGNIAFAYEDYGFPYCFSASLFNTGINEPTGYGKETMEKINEEEETDEKFDGKIGGTTSEYYCSYSLSRFSIRQR